jgi:S-adenosylmethionine decarboxylase
MNEEVFGPHIMIDLWDCPKEVLANYDLHFKFLKEMPEMIGMTPITQPYVFPYAGLVPEDKGITGIVIIAESHISVHSFEDKGWTFIDVFSCKPFDTELCQKYILELFKPGNFKISTGNRGIGFPR